MTRWPRVLAYLDRATAEHDDAGRYLAAAAAVGPALGLVARLPGGTADQLAALAQRAVAHATPPGAAVWVSGRADIALAVGAQGVVHRAGDLTAVEADAVAERAARPGRLHHIAAVHGLAEARAAVASGAEALVVGTIWESASHPGRPGAGPALLSSCAELGVPVYAIGGVTPERAALARAHGAWGVAAIRAIWRADDVYQAARALLSEVDSPTAKE